MSAAQKDSDRTVAGVKEFLATLPEDEVYGILKTSTCGIGVTRSQSKEDAINDILKYSDGVSILNRRRVKKEYLIRYLIQKNISFTLNTNKSELCRLILEHWEYAKAEKLKDFRFLESSQTKKASIFANSSASISSQPTPSEPVASYSKSSQQQPILCRRPEPIITNPPVTIPPQVISAPVIHTAEIGTNTVCIGTQIAAIRDDFDEAMDYEEYSTLRRKEQQIGQDLAQQFAKWFYERLNALQDFVPGHFWSECNLRLEIVGQNKPDERQISEYLHDGRQCFQQLCLLRTERQLLFNANLLTGVRGKINPHGLAQVMVCGTLHLPDGNKVGVFEQVFGLSKDPCMENNFKVKFTVLQLREGNHLTNSKQPPALCDSTMIGILEEEDSEDEQGLD